MATCECEPAVIHPGGEARVTLDVKNTGDRAGVEPSKLYLHEQFTPGFDPRQATPRVRTRGVESRRNQNRLFEADPGRPPDYSISTWAGRSLPGDFEIMVGKSSAENLLQGMLT